MATPIRGVRVDLTEWSLALAVLKRLKSPHRVAVTLRPGMSRTDAVNAFIAHIANLQEDQ